MKTAALILIVNINLLFMRYVVFDMNDKIVEGIIFQLPWDSLIDAMNKRRFFQLN